MYSLFPFFLFLAVFFRVEQFTPADRVEQFTPVDATHWEIYIALP